MKTFIISSLCIGLLLATNCNLSPCSPGQHECSDGTCAPEGNVCCGNGTSCPGGTICGPGDTCLTPGSGGSCLSLGKETCQNTDGTEDCAPIGAACCGNHHFCPVGTVCINGGTSCGQ